MAVRKPAPNHQLPWHHSYREDRRFWQILGSGMVVFLLLAIVIPFIETPEPEREELERLPPQLARVVLEEKELPEPEPQPAQEPEEETEPEEPAEEEPEPEPEPEPQPVERVQQAREKAQQSGVLQFADDLAEMRDSVDVSEVSEANITRNNGEAAELERDVIASRAESTSGGVDTSELSRDTGGAALSGQETTQVESKMAEAGSTRGEGSPGSSDGRQRSDENIRAVMDRNKSAIFAIYNRELRRDPTLEGRVIVELVIEPDGSVSAVDIVSSDLDHDELETKILARVAMINFGAEDVDTTTINYTFDFMPS